MKLYPSLGHDQDFRILPFLLLRYDVTGLSLLTVNGSPQRYGDRKVSDRVLVFEYVCVLMVKAMQAFGFVVIS